MLSKVLEIRQLDLIPQNSENFPRFPNFRICFMAKNENPETPEINRKLSKSKKHPVLTIYRC